MRFSGIFAAMIFFAIQVCGSAVYVSDCSIGPVGGPYITQADGGNCSVGYALDYGFNEFIISGIAADERNGPPPYEELGAGTEKYLEGIPSSPLAYSIVVSAYKTYETAGPLRAGFISYSTENSNHPGDSSQAGISDGIHTYGQGSCADCGSSMDRAPFELGTAFSALAAAAETGLLSHSPSSGASLGFSLFEADAVTPVDILDAPVDTPGIPINFNAPEPATFGMCLLMLALGAAYFLRNRTVARR